VTDMECGWKPFQIGSESFESSQNGWFSPAGFFYKLLTKFGKGEVQSWFWGNCEFQILY